MFEQEKMLIENELQIEDKWVDNSREKGALELEASEVIEERFGFEHEGSVPRNLSYISSSSAIKAKIRSVWVSDTPEETSDMKLSILLTTENNDNKLIEYPIGASEFWDVRIKQFFKVLNISSDQVENAIGAEVYVLSSSSRFLS